MESEFSGSQLKVPKLSKENQKRDQISSFFNAIFYTKQNLEKSKMEAT